jgi:hypothetical protein
MRAAGLACLLFSSIFFCLFSARSAIQQNVEPTPLTETPIDSDTMAAEPEVADAPVTGQEASDPVPVSSAPAGSTVVTSIPECADYVGKVRTCIAHLASIGVISPEMRTEAYQTLQQIIRTWQDTTDRTALARTCAIAYQRSKGTYNSHGCDF